MALKGIYHVNVNCSELEKSRAFYEQFGYRVMMDMRNPKPHPATEELYQAFGLPRNSYCDGYMMAIPGNKDMCKIDLLQWRVEPGFEPENPPSHAQSLGYQRVDIFCTDWHEELKRLHEAGIDPIAPVCDVPYAHSQMMIAAFRDPDGTLVELCGIPDDAEQRERSMKNLYRDPADFKEQK